MSFRDGGSGGSFGSGSGSGRLGVNIGLLGSHEVKEPHIESFEFANVALLVAFVQQAL